MERLNEAGAVLVKRAVTAHEYGLQGFSRECGVSRMRIVRSVERGHPLSSEEMGYLAEKIGWPKRYIVVRK